jgi:hypothetical protein
MAQEKAGVRSVLIDAPETKDITQNTSGTHTWTRAENVPPRFSALHITSATQDVAALLTGITISSGDQLFELNSWGAIEAWCNRGYKSGAAIAHTTLRVPLDFPEPRLKGMAEVKAVTSVALDYTEGDTGADSFRIGFEQMFDVPPLELRVNPVNQNLAAGANNRVELPRFDGKLKSILFNDFSDYTRLRIKNAALGIVIDSRAEHVRSQARDREYYGLTAEVAYGVDFDRNGDMFGLMSREQLEIIATCTAGNEEQVYFETYK